MSIAHHSVATGKLGAGEEALIIGVDGLIDPQAEGARPYRRWPEGRGRAAKGGLASAPGKRGSFRRAGPPASGW
jgi:hypothetical protein